MQTHETFETLMMKAVDGRLTAPERAMLDEHLPSCDSCREELEDFQRIKESTDLLGERIMRDAMSMPPRESRGRRWFVLAATGLFVAGFLILLGYSAHLFLSDEEVPLIVKAAVSLLAAGTAMLAGLAVYQRLRGQGRDPYQEIDQ